MWFLAIHLISGDGYGCRNAFYVKIPIGYGEDLQEYFMHIDTGSGVTWVMCKGRGPITTVVSVPSHRNSWHPHINREHYMCESSL